ncbi:hypothetical protein CKAH01_18334 [Colletotrichum kahawae]|uniref:Uncharacterized protein n=1 Tax=Colletotrichum kahawae TaxID=34407 RepID=A0AAD9YAA4_COLKA|nr:hypothetical protein CKAH01_18334 [Colletotrichum kahawae]
MQEHSTQQVAGDSTPKAQKNAAEKLSGAMMNKGVGMESIGKASDSKDNDKDGGDKDNDKDGGDKDVGENNIDGNCTLEELLEEGEELLEDLRHFKMQDQMTLSVHPIMRAALMEDGAARREENHKAWAVSRDLFIARAEAAISNKQATAQKPNAEEAQAIRLLQEYLRMKTIVL